MFVAHKTSRAFESVQDLREYLEVPVETIFLLPFVADMSWLARAPPPTWRDLTESRKKYWRAPIQTREDHIGGRSSPLAISATINHKSENQPNTTLTATEQRRRHERRR
ncbi:hypothetical protein F2Q70_00041408 [Brassica cretica]|uniref:Uncharacterized protein n=1 Tax=Brassica cretica TaxID=69181 RepID=A0A8S9K8H3_BRACR|nr:hypothetical protein F2Q70_00041408 [Brassica cretica]